MKHFDKAVLIALLAFGTHSTLVARNTIGGGKGLSDNNLTAPAVSAANATLQSQQTKSTKLSGKVLDAMANLSSVPQLLKMEQRM